MTGLWSLTSCTWMNTLVLSLSGSWPWSVAMTTTCSQPVLPRSGCKSIVESYLAYHDNSNTGALTKVWLTYPIFKHKYVEKKGLAAMLAINRSAGTTLDVNLRNLMLCDKAYKDGIYTLALKPRRDVNRSPKQGYQSPNKKTDMVKKTKKKRLSRTLPEVHTWATNTLPDGGSTSNNEEALPIDGSTEYSILALMSSSLSLASTVVT